MALQKQTYNLSIVDGLDTKTDDKNVIPTRFLELENSVFTKTGSLSKRYGGTAIPNDILGGGKIASGAALTTFQDELLLYSNNDLYTFSEANQKWADKGTVNFGTTNEISVSADGNILKNPNYDLIENIACYVYESKVGVSTTNTEYRIVDNETETVLFTGTISGEIAPKVIALDNKFFITTISGTTVRFRTVVITAASVISGPTNVLSNANTYDTTKIGDKVFVFGGGTANGATVLFINSDSTTSAGINVDNSDTFDVFSVAVENTNDVRLCWAKSTSTGAKTVLYVYNLSVALHANTPIFAGSAVTNLSSGNNTGSSSIFGSLTSPTKEVVETSITSAGVVGPTVILLYQGSLQSKAVKYNGRYYFIAVKDETGSTQQTVRTFFMLTDMAEIIGKWQFDNSVVRNVIGDLRVEGTEICFPGADLTEFQSPLITAAGVLAAPTAIKKFCMDFSPVNNYFDVKLGADLHIAGGILKMYDGDKVVEHGFLEIPKTPTASVSSNGPNPGIGLTSAASQVEYVTVFSWRDRAGQLHRSAPSVPVIVQIPQAAPNYSKVTLNVFTTSLTNKTNVQIEIYRTEENGVIFYRVNDALINRIFNDKTVASISFVDDFPSDQIIDNEPLYTTGGVLENIAAESSKAIVSYKNRVVTMLSSGEALQYSKLRQQNGPVEFNDSLIIQLDEAGGLGVTLGVMDDHIIIFKERGIFALTGEGPNNLGEQDDFRKPYRIASDVGCIDANSVVEMPGGLMFKSEKGIYLLQRGFAVQYLGAPVEKYNSLTITASNLLADTNEIRFSTLTGRTLVYDYFHNRWSTFTAQTGIDAVIYKNQWSYLRASGTVLAETPGRYDDNGSYYSTKMVSAWISLAGLQGFERFYKMQFLGNYKTNHKVKVSFAYDFADFYVSEVLIDAGTLLDTIAFNEGLYSEGTYQGEFPLYQFEVRSKVQKCEAFKIMIQDFEDSGTGEAFTVSNLAALVGIKTGLFKRPATRTFGAS